MANPLDTDAGSELFSSYEAEFKLVQADLTQKLDQIPELNGEPRKAAISQAERALEEADELVCTPSPPCSKQDTSLIAHNPVYSSAKCASRSKTSLPQPGAK